MPENKKHQNEQIEENADFYRVAVDAGIITISDDGVKTIDILRALATQEGQEKFDEFSTKNEELVRQAS